MLWTDGSVPFLSGKGGSGVLANCSLCGTEATLFFSAALCWFRQHLQVCHFYSVLLLSDSCSVLATLSSSTSFLLPQSLWHELSSLSPCSIRLQWVHGHSFLPGNDAVDDLAEWVALFVPCAIPCSLSLSLLSLVSTLIFFMTGGVLSHLNSSTHRFPRFPLRNLCSFVTLAVFPLVFAAKNTAYC